MGNLNDNILLDVKGLKKHFPIRKGYVKSEKATVKAVDGVNLFIKEGETLGIVGESGCGKTTAGRSILRLIEPTEGEISFKSKKLAGPGEKYRQVDVMRSPPKELKSLRQEMQIIFQDPYSSLDPRMTVGRIVGEPLRAHALAKGERADRVAYLLESVGLKPDHANRYPHEFSGGQRQRIGIARALAPNPSLVVADEPVSALDVSIQAQVTNLLLDLQQEFDLTYMFIGHDLSVVKYVSDRVAVMYLGKVVELVSAGKLFSEPKHPYTEALMSAVPVPDPDFEMKRILLQGDVPSPVNPPSGCHFHPRCQYARDICKEKIPEYRDLGGEHFVACHRADELDLLPVVG
ncbi:ABC transporter ATP-binding protein [Dethiosulfatarculus sandiegensis]|uniref:Peptide ABC transporter ATP-binding protein n=1 Tax=Dethiosulfatarculus sandiegensis TaxID=1429043 RepID=A0A0D2HSZ8_9BACT|nr:dipeptide ABC transporter ATP-binding protein [Dethiosulfatarculus sandiegensis]KIX13673.1 peptide ABC transporter ATP-binding protein [Dethiosulfatarculus sandiegensis]